MTTATLITYRARACACMSRGCTAWHVSPCADVLGVQFTRQQALLIAELLNRHEKQVRERSRSVNQPPEAA